MTTHVSVALEVPQSGSEFLTACGVTIQHVGLPFLIDGDARTADLVQLGNCWPCRRKLKVPATGRYVIFGACEAQELAVEAGEFKDLEEQ